MTRYRFRGIFLLLLMGHATACTIWQAPVPTGSPVGESKSDRSLALADYIEIEQPDQVRVTLEDGSQFLLYAPEVEGDVVVSSVNSTVIAIADIVKLEVPKKDGLLPAIDRNKKNIIITSAALWLYGLGCFVWRIKNFGDDLSFPCY